MDLRATMANVAYRAQVGARLPCLLGRDCITIGHTIYVAGGRSRITAYLLAHEFCHVLQWRHLGAARFLWRYVVGLVQHGYSHDHPMEAEAHEYGLERHELFASTARFMRGES